MWSDLFKEFMSLGAVTLKERKMRLAIGRRSYSRSRSSRKSHFQQEDGNDHDQA